MISKKFQTTLSALFLAIALVAAGCGASESAQGDTAATDTSTADSTENADVESAAASTKNQESHFDSGDLDYDKSDIVVITLDGASANADSANVTIDGSTVTVTAEGVYSFNGTLSDGQVIVDAADSDDVILILEGADITNSDGAALAVMNTDKAVIVLAEGSTNRITDGADYSFPDDETDEPNAALYSASDLTIAGGGELIVNASYNDGIASKDGLVIESGAISVTAADDGIRGKDYAIINGGTISIEAGGDGIKADNDEDAERGYVLISDGVVDIAAGDDGVQAATGVTIDGGTLTVAAGDDGVKGDLFVMINDGTVTITDSYEGIEAEVITINDGVIDITSNDDGINVTSADAVTQAAPVDGAVGRPARGERGGQGSDEAVGENYVYINGGTTVITITDNLDEQGDGIDANGHIVMTGGVVAVSGATDTRNSAVDYSGGSFEMTGGLLIGTNVDGRNSEGIGEGSSQASLYITTGSTVSAETVVHIESTNGDNLVTFQPANEFSVIVFSSPDLVEGESYDVYLGGSVSGDAATNLYEADAYTAGDLIGTVTARV